MRPKVYIPIVLVIAGCVIGPGISQTSGTNPSVTVSPGDQNSTVNQTGTLALSIAVSNLTLGTGQTYSLGTSVKDANGLVPEGISWRSSDNSVATVDPSSGAISAVGPGDAVVTAFYQSNPSVAAQVTIRVTQTPTVSLIRIKPSSFELAVGNTQQVTAEVDLPDGEINSNVVWSSSDNTVVTINQTSGVVTALKPGIATIIGAYAVDPTYKGLANVTVLPLGATPAPTPSPTSVVFGPGATPVPSSSPSAAGGVSPSPSVAPTGGGISLTVQ